MFKPYFCYTVRAGETFYCYKESKEQYYLKNKAIMSININKSYVQPITWSP